MQLIFLPMLEWTTGLKVQENCELGGISLLIVYFNNERWYIHQKYNSLYVPYGIDQTDDGMAGRRSVFDEMYMMIYWLLIRREG